MAFNSVVLALLVTTAYREFMGSLILVSMVVFCCLCSSVTWVPRMCVVVARFLVFLIPGMMSAFWLLGFLGSGHDLVAGGLLFMGCLFNSLFLAIAELPVVLYGG